MLNLLVETKNEYTIHLINILTPLIFEGLQSIYKEASSIAGPNDILKVFQSFLNRVPKWNQMIIEKETNRIINSSQSYGWLNDLIKATLKANLTIFMYNPSLRTQVKVNPAFYQDIKTQDFIHRIYIECARELYNNPYLLYHNYPPIEIKRNQRDCMSIIKECIKESIRKLLPVKHILQVYLGEEMEVNNLDNENVDRVMSEVEERNLAKLIKKDLADEDERLPEAPIVPVLELKKSDSLQPTQEMFQTPEPVKPTTKQTDSEDKTIGSRILNIINKNSDTSSHKAKTNTRDMSSTSDGSFRRSTLNSKNDDELDSLSDLAKSIKKYDDTLNKNNKESFDDRIKKILQKDLAPDSDLETSLNYSHEDNLNKYQEVFSNSVVTPNKDGLAKPSEQKNKNKFFNNYLQF